MGTLLNFQFVVVLNLLVAMICLASSPYLAPRAADGPRFPTSPLYIILAILTALAFILDIVFLAGGHAH
jgi:hypothetical protein